MMPCMVNMLLQEGLLQVNIIYASKLNDVNMLAGMGLANTLINCTTISITYGLSGVLETFVSQSYGSKEY
jgi:Na+-driven multidrug efflux pump